MSPWFLAIIQFVIVLASAPLMVGIIRKTKARFQNRRGASVFQPYWSLASLMRKDMTVSKHTSWVFRAVPFAVLATALVLAAVVPTLALGTGLGGYGNVFLVAGILAVGAAFLVLGGMDVASTFGNMGSSREMTLTALVEPVLIMCFAAFGYATGEWTVEGMVHYSAGWYLVHPFLLVSLIALGMAVLSENARYPVDNPATHLELTMVHEAMILEYSGPYLALLEYASALKLTVLSVLFVNFVFPFMMANPSSSPFGVALAVALYAAKLLISAFAIAFAESVLVKMRFYRMQEYMSTAFLFGLVGFILAIIF